MIVKYMAYDSELYVTDPDDQAGHGETFVVEYNDHVKEMKEVLEALSQLHNTGHFGSDSGQFAFANGNDILDKYRHYQGDGK